MDYTNIQIIGDLWDAVEHDNELVLVKVIIVHDDFIERVDIAVEHLVQVVGKSETKLEVGAPAGPLHLDLN